MKYDNWKKFITYCSTKELYNYLKLLQWLIHTKILTDADILLFIIIIFQSRNYN